MPGHPPAESQEEGVDAKSRRRIEMGAQVEQFNGTHPDTDPGYNVAAEKLKRFLQQAIAAAAAQRDGLVAVRAASARKEELRRLMLAVPIAHLAEVGRAAARDDHELGTAFRFKPGSATFQAFRTAARGMQLEADTNREVLVKHGLSESVLEQFGRQLDEFDAAVALGIDGRSRHMGATAELRRLGVEIARAVRVMSGRNRLRFEDDPQVLASWLAASSVRGTPRGDSSETVPPQQPPTGEVRPAA
jgi:hypothetical protein